MFVFLRTMLQISGCSLSVDDEALHAVVIRNDIGRPDIITEKHGYSTHVSLHTYLKPLNVLIKILKRKTKVSHKEFV